MQRIFILVYVIATAIIAIVSSILEVQPALFLIDIFAPHVGDRYSLTLVLLLTWLILLSPLFVILLIARIMRMKKDEVITPDRIGIFVTRKKSLQSGMVGIPVYINDRKAGILDNGKTKFFDTHIGVNTVQVGDGKRASEVLTANLTQDKQVHFEMEIMQAGLGLKYYLKQL